MDDMVDGQLGNEIDGCGDDVEQFVCAQVNSTLQIRYLKKRKQSEKKKTTEWEARASGALDL